MRQSFAEAGVYTVRALENSRLEADGPVKFLRDVISHIVDEAWTG